MKKTITKRLTAVFCVVIAMIFTLSIAACTSVVVTLESISITTAPTKTEYTEGESFDATGMVVTAKYDDGSSKAITAYTYSPSGALTTSDTAIVVTYTENEVTKTASQAITVNSVAALSSIEITTAPTKTAYSEGETFDKTGMVVTAKYDNGSSKTVTSYSYSPVTALTLSDTSVTISYTENGVTKTAKQNITVSAAAVISLEVTSAADTMQYNLGDTFDPTGIEVTATYGNGVTKSLDITDCDVEPTVLGVNDTAIKVSYTENGKTVSGYYSSKIRISAPEVDDANNTEVAEELLFSGTNTYELEGGAVTGTWSSDGNSFSRLRTNKTIGAGIIFTHDYSTLADKSLAGFRVIMSNARGGTVVQVSNDKSTWTTIAEAGEGRNTIPADYKYPCTSIDGKTATDSPNFNVYYCYYSLADYIDDTNSTIYVRFGYEDPSQKGWLGADVEGADLMHSCVFYNSIDLAKVSGVNALESVSVKTQPTTTTYVEGATFDAAGLVLEATWTDGTTTEITSGFSYSTSALTTSDTSVTVNYTIGGVTKSVDIAISVYENANTLVSISVTTMPTKTVYREGDTFDATGMVVTATYADNSTAVVTGYTVNLTTLSTTDTYVTISYMEKTCTCSIKVLQTALTSSDKVVSKELLFTDSSNYTLTNDGSGTKDATKGTSRYFTDGTEAVRLRANNNNGACIQFTYTYTEDDSALTKAGFMFYGLNTRMGTYVDVSVDGGTTWIRIMQATASDSVLPAEWSEFASNIVSTQGSTATDKNMYAMYFSLANYVSTSKTIYIRIGCNTSVTYNSTSGNSAEGADIFGSITFYSYLDLTKVVA